MRYGKIKILIQKRKIKIAKYKNYPNPTKSIFQIAFAGNVEQLSGWNNHAVAETGIHGVDFRNFAP